MRSPASTPKLTLAWTANGEDERIAAASKELVKMLVSIAMAALTYVGVKGNMGKAAAIADSMPTTLPAFAVAGGGQVTGARAGTAAATGVPGPAGPVGTAMATTTKDEGEGGGSSKKGSGDKTAENPVSKEAGETSGRGQRVRIGARWKARDITDAACERGCEDVARQIQKHIGGEIRQIRPRDAPKLGAFRSKNWKWDYHEVVVKDGRVYDITTGHEGLPIAEYKQLWQYSDAIEFGF